MAGGDAGLPAKLDELNCKLVGSVVLECVWKCSCTPTDIETEIDETLIRHQTTRTAGYFEILLNGKEMELGLEIGFSGGWLEA